MKRLERLRRRVSVRTAIIAGGLMACLAFAATPERVVGLFVLAATAIGATSPVTAAAENNDTAIRPFRVAIPDKELIELRRRVQATRWPSKELVADRSQGVQIATL